MHGKGDGFQRMPKVSNGMVYVGCGSMLRSSKIDGPHNPPNPHEIFNSCCRSDFAGFCMLLFWTSWTSNVSVFWGRTSLDIFGMSTCIFWLDVHWPPGFELPKRHRLLLFKLDNLTTFSVAPVQQCMKRSFDSKCADTENVPQAEESGRISVRRQTLV